RVDRLGNRDGDDLAGLHELVRFRRLAGDRDVALFDQPLNLRARSIRENRRQEAIEANTVAVGRNGQVHAALRARFGSGASARDRYTSMTIASGASRIEMNCDVENMPTVPRSSPRKNSMMNREIA